MSNVHTKIVVEMTSNKNSLGDNLHWFSIIGSNKSGITRNVTLIPHQLLVRRSCHVFQIDYSMALHSFHAFHVLVSSCNHLYVGVRKEKKILNWSNIRIWMEFGALILLWLFFISHYIRWNVCFFRFMTVDLWVQRWWWWKEMWVQLKKQELPKHNACIDKKKYN